MFFDLELEEVLISVFDIELCDFVVIFGMYNLIMNIKFCNIMGSSNGVD